ncbi:MAG: hypothetical protein ACRD7E_14280 [Bryobacteraceae bacterium]
MKQTKRIALNLIAILAGTAVFAGNAKADDDKRILTLDVASDCRTFNYMRGLSLDQIVRADRFMMNGTIYRAGDLRSGSQSNDPNAPGAIGTWVARGASTGSLAQHVANPTQPAIYWTQYLSLSGGMIVTEGWHAPNGANDNAVVGGTRTFRGASGEVRIETLGTNVTGCANTRFRVIFTKRD